MIVVDASAMLDLLLRREQAEAIAAELGRHERVEAPHLLDTEALSGLRRWVRAGKIPPALATEVRHDLAALPIARHPHAPLSDRVWTLRDRLSAYDATYVALAEGLGASLLTTDLRLADAAAGLVGIVAPTPE